MSDQKKVLENLIYTPSTSQLYPFQYIRILTAVLLVITLTQRCTERGIDSLDIRTPNYKYFSTNPK